MKIMKVTEEMLGLSFYDENDNLVKNNITNDFNDNKILNVQSIEINDEPSSNNHACNKEYTDNILILLLSLTDSNILLQYGYKDDEILIIKKLALEKIHRQKQLKDYIKANLIE